jgi:pimeloyl-ACP methyl ester carboxylesterase
MGEERDRGRAAHRARNINLPIDLSIDDEHGGLWLCWRMRTRLTGVDASTALLVMPFGMGLEVFVALFDQKRRKVRCMEAMKCSSRETIGGTTMKDNTIKTRSIQSFARKAGRILLIIFSVLLAVILGLVGVLLAWSHPGKPEPFVDQNGRPLSDSISEKMYVTINGVKQGMFIKGKDKANPVLLYLHGGMPDYFLTKRYPTGLEDYFTVVWWEQRGAGMSYRAGIPPETVTVEQLISDTLEVTNYVRHRFGKDKIYLMGHSGGTFIGIQAAARAPQLYYAYIGVAQMSNQLKSEKLAYDYMLQQFKANGNTKMVRKLEAAPVTMTGGTPAAYRAVRDEAMHSLGVGTTHDMKSVLSDLVLRSLQSREYTFGEKVNTWRAKASSGVSIVWGTILAMDLSKQVPELDLPVYFFHGIYDYTASYTEAKAYFEKLKAPVKGFYTFEQSAHSPIFEEPEKVRKILQEDVLVGANSLADVK